MHIPSESRGQSLQITPPHMTSRDSAGSYLADTLMSCLWPLSLYSSSFWPPDPNDKMPPWSSPAHAPRTQSLPVNSALMTFPSPTPTCLTQFPLFQYRVPSVTGLPRSKARSHPQLSSLLHSAIHQVLILSLPRLPRSSPDLHLSAPLSWPPIWAPCFPLADSSPLSSQGDLCKTQVSLA